MKNYLLLLAVAATVGFTSCGKDDDEASKTPAKSKTELLTKAGWKTTAITVNPGFDFDNDGTPETDLFTGTDPCDADDITVYKADKTYTEEEGATKCDPTDDQVYGQGTWAFTANEAGLMQVASDSSTMSTFNIAELTENTLKLTESFQGAGGTTYTLTITQTH